MDHHQSDPDHANAHLAGDSEDPAAGPTWTIGIASVLVCAACFIGFASIHFYTESREQERKIVGEVVNIAPLELEMLRREQSRRLEGPVRIERRIDGEDSLVIPIEDAMARLVEESSRP